MNGTPAEASALKRRAALISILASVVLTLAKAVAAFLSGSLALLTDALQGLIDIGSTMFTFLAVRAADKPADDEHHYGHGKVEALAALLETAIMFGLSGAILWEAGNRLWTGTEPAVEVTPIVVGVLLFSMLVDATRWRTLATVGKETRSEALSAEALHFATDFVGTALVLVGLILTRMGVPMADSFTALCLAIFMVVTAYRLGRRTLDTLIDAAPRGMSEQVAAIVTAMPAVVGTQWVRLRPSGGRVIGEVGIHVSRSLPLDQVTQIKRDLQERIRAQFPELDATVTADPIALDDESALERVLIAAGRLRVPVHHVTIQRVGEMEQLSVSLDVEVDSTLTMDAAHAVASELEAAIRTEFGAGTEVETHIEPLETGAPAGLPASWDIVNAIGEILAGEAAKGGVVTDVHSVRVRETVNGLMVNYHARVDGSLDVASAHIAVDRMERALRERRPDVCRVVTHAEPKRRKEPSPVAPSAVPPQGE
jgi:cation diffusion facilitator family transporter